MQRDVRAPAARRLDSLEEVRAALAHDFNHMAAVIVAISEALANDPASDPEDRRLAQVALKAAERAAQLLRRMMRPARGRSVVVERIDTAAALGAAVDFARVLVPPKVTLSVTAPKRPPAVVADRVALESALLNLCINAGQAMMAGGELSLEVRRTRLPRAAAATLGLAAGDYAAFHVRDNGPGMTPNVLARATEPRFTTRRGRGGSGLGLSSVDVFAKSAGGALSLASREGCGVTAVIYLPLAGTQQTPRSGSGGAARRGDA